MTSTSSLRVHTSSPVPRDGATTPLLTPSGHTPRIGRWIPPPQAKDEKLKLHIDGYWYDLTKWKHQHPGGSAILEHLNGKDATDAFYSLHSKEALARLEKMHRVAATPTELQIPAECTAFRKFRQQLIQEGWFNRSMAWETFYMCSVYFLASIGTYFGTTGHPWLAILCIGLAMQQGGWIGHDYTHGRGDFPTFMGRIFGPLVNGFSRAWWSEKHNTHHVYTNYLGVDTDVDNDPVFHLFFPDQKNDPSYRAYQHIYFIPVVSLLYPSWRLQSIQHAWRSRDYLEFSMILINYAWLACLPLSVSIGSIFLGGFLVGIIVTATHQSEEMIHAEDQINQQYNYVRTQFDTTRDAACETVLMEWLWGGMQYQLEHHLFPTMPKYKYAALVPHLKQFALDNNLNYRVDSVWTILERNFYTLKYYAKKVEDVMATSPSNSSPNSPRK